MSKEREKQEVIKNKNKNKKNNEAEGQNLYDELWKMETIEHKASNAKREFYKNAKRSAF